MSINTLQEAASALDRLNVYFVKTETSIAASTEGKSETGHKFSVKLTIEICEDGPRCSVFGFGGEDLFDTTPENAIEEYSSRSSMVKSSDGN